MSTITALTLDQVGTRFEIEAKYHVEFSPESYIIIAAGVEYGSAGSRFDHPNVVARIEEIHEVKHYLRNGGKRWSAHLGVDYYFAIPKSAITLHLEKGYSYVPVTINGVKTSLNVSGGTDSNIDGGWCDWVHRVTHTHIRYTLRDLKALAEVALSVEECQRQGITLDREHRIRTGFLARVAEKKVKLAPGMKVMLADGWSWCGERGPFNFQHMSRRTPICTTEGGSHLKVLPRSIDWIETARLNNIELPAQSAWNKLGKIEQK